MRTLLAVIVLAAGTPAFAQALADGEVRRVDREGAKVTLRHGPIPSLDMPPMTMVFRVQEPAAIERLKVGDRIRFAAERIDGQYTVTRIEEVK
jgi:Cu/Ag efflux protein CusF